MPASTPPPTAPPLSVPEDLAGLTDDELQELHDSIDARADELDGLDDNDFTPEIVDEIERLASDGTRIRETQAQRQTEHAERVSRARNGLAALRPSEDQVQDGEEDVALDEIKDEDDEDDEDEKGTAPVVIAAETKKDDDDEDEAAIAASSRVPARTRPRAEAGLATMKANRSRSLAPRPKGSTFMTATHNVLGQAEGSELIDHKQVAAAIAKKRTSFTNTAPGARDYLTIATGQKAIDPEATVGGDPLVNFGVLDRLREEHEGLVASGGCCAPFTPLYDFFRTAEAQSPIEDGLPVVQAPRGGIRYIVPPDWRDAMSAIGTRTCAEDLNPATADKPCVHVTCPDVVECSVLNVSQCVQFGNLGYRIFPEQVEAFLADTAVAFALRKETAYITAIDAASTQVSALSEYGASRALLTDVVVSATEYRKRNAMRRSATLQAIFPDWVLDVFRNDMVNDSQQGMNFFGVTDAQVIAFLRARDIDPIFYNDLSTGGPFGTIASAQAAGNVHALPKVVNWWLFAPGTFIRLDGGTLDVGLVRDSALNRTNDLELFMEEWTGVCMLGIESMNVVSVLCPSGEGPALGTLMTCP